MTNPDIAYSIVAIQLNGSIFYLHGNIVKHLSMLMITNQQQQSPKR